MNLASCPSVVDYDAAAVCTELSAQLTALSWHPWVTALRGVLAAGLTAYLSTSGSLKAKKTDRRNLSQREALYGAQDAAQALLSRWTQLKDWHENGERGQSPFPSHEEQDLLGALEKVVSRIEEERIRGNFYEWRDTARFFFHASDGYDLHDERISREKAIREAGKHAANLDK
ncbi:hypothetical protein [Paeniglutamicibacter psychrophenolicus]|uniref:SMODS and SLOG-associating 2TM effector domain-containing protein n=1 Tax=Paeniglutamicibacter psychrophenolicus TaxID=257454 RepID=A0ABS4WAC2_9MICC|nr:hypothetical protein [Paeniglutamicibacter psychrophenolicus]MBP2373154.1 hypothetical protein [Paeniglutamicibacter psychrophenolicus]